MYTVFETVSDGKISPGNHLNRNCQGQDITERTSKRLFGFPNIDLESSLEACWGIIPNIRTYSLPNGCKRRTEVRYRILIHVRAYSR